MLFKALDFDIDISIQAGTKYLIGHSDYMLGTAVANARCWDRLREYSYLMGQMVDADTAYMASRGLRTLSVRLKQHERSSIEVAHWLAARPEVATVNHPALPSCKGHEFYRRDFSGCNGLFSFVLKERLDDAQLAAYGQLQPLQHGLLTGRLRVADHANQPEELEAIRPAGGVDFSGTLVRLHIGTENVEDLIADLAAGFDRLNGVR